MRSNFERYIKIIIKVLGWVFAFFSLVFVLLTLIFHVPAIQTRLADIVLDKLEQQTKAEVDLEKLAVTFPDKVILKKLYIPDDRNDTLLYAQKIEVDIDLWKLLNRKLIVNKLDLQTLYGNMIRYRPDSTFNFDHLIDSFTSKEKAEAKEKESPSMEFSVQELKWTDLRFNFLDSLNQSYFQLSSGELNINMNKLDLNQLTIDVEDAEIENTFVHFVIDDKKVAANEESSTSALHINLEKNLALKNIRFLLEDNFSKKIIGIESKEIGVNQVEVDLAQKMIYVESLNNDETRTIIKQRYLSKHDSVGLDKYEKHLPKEDSDFSWKIIAEELNISKNRFRMLDRNMESVDSLIDFKNLYLHDISSTIKNTSIKSDGINTTVEEFRFTEQSGFKLRNAQIEFESNSQKVHLNKLDIRTNNSKIDGHVNIGNTGVFEFPENVDQLVFDVDFRKGNYIGLNDLKYFLSNNKLFVSEDVRSGKIHFLAGLHGKADRIFIDTLYSQIDSTYLSISGELSNVRHIKASAFNLFIHGVQFHKKDIRKYDPGLLDSLNINLPSKGFLKGQLQGTYLNSRLKMDLSTDWGGMSLKSQVEIDTVKKEQLVHGDLKLNDLKLGYMLEQPDTLGGVTMEADFKAQLTEFSKPRLNTTTRVDSVKLLGYTYKDIHIDGYYESDSIYADIEVEDENLLMDLRGQMRYKDSIPDIDMYLNLKGIDLQSVNLSEGHMAVKGIMDLQLSGTNPDDMNGDVKFTNVMIVKQAEEYFLDSLVAVIRSQEKDVKFNINSDFIKADYKGNLHLSSLGKALPGFIDSYFNLNTNKDSILFADNFEFKAEILPSDLLTEVLLPSLENYSAIELSASMKSDMKDLAVNFSMPSLTYGGTKVDSFLLTVQTLKDVLDMELRVNQITSGVMSVDSLRLLSEIGSDTANISFETGPANKLKYRVSADVISEQGAYKIAFREDLPVILNEREFNIEGSRNIWVGSEEKSFERFVIQSENQKMYVLSDTADVRIGFENFFISNFTGIIQEESDIINGMIQGDIKFFKKDAKSMFAANLGLNEIDVLNERSFDQINVSVKNPEINQYELQLAFVGPGNRGDLSGVYNLNDSSVNGLVDIESLSLSLPYLFLKDNFQKLQGMVSTDIKLDGTIQDPLINGNLSFKDVVMQPEAIGVALSIKDEDFLFSDKSLTMNEVQVMDEENNEMLISGTVDLPINQAFAYDLNVEAENFIFLDRPQEAGAVYYGKFIAGLDADLKGDLSQPVLDATLNVNEQTDAFFVVQNLNPPTIRQEGIVEFISSQDTVSGNIIGDSYPETGRLKYTPGMNINMNANINIDEQSQFTLVVDPWSGEQLQVSGDGNLSLVMRGNDELNLTGEYIIDQGEYTLRLYNVIRRDFEIQKNSTIRWSGDPTDARVDISAVYIANASPSSLIGAQTTGLTNEQISGFKEKMPFEVILNVSDYLLKPSIDFDLALPETEQNAVVQSKLNQLNQNENQLNKQVFSLLVFNNFISQGAASETPLAYELNATARSSVSNLLTQQLNSFTDRYIKGFDVNVDVESYAYQREREVAGRTRVGLNVEKELFNERLKVTVGGNVNVEDPEKESQMDASDIAGDVSVEYKLTPDGTYILKGFNKTEYEDVITGEVTKTGVSVIFNKDFERLWGWWRLTPFNTEQDTISNSK